ncbi:MAG: sensor histidine kinase [Rhizobium sp.]|nr:sensor histidine kinase [Rhizobium sp.]
MRSGVFEVDLVQRFLWHAKNMSENELSPFFITALLDMNASLILQDSDNAYLLVTGLPDIWKVDNFVEPADDTIFGGAIASRLEILRNQARNSGRTEIIEVVHDDGRLFEFRVLAFPGRLNRTQLITTIIDRSEERRREKILQSLLRDVSHRSKNLLAIIQSIVTQTSQYTDTIDAYVQKLRGRIFSLSRSQDLVTDSGWRGAFAHELLDQQVSAYIPSGQDLIRFEGENILLSPNVTMHLGLAFHELLINAINYGTFLAAGDQIRVVCSIIDIGQVKHIQVDWNEPVNPRFRSIASNDDIPVRRLGTAILERVVPASVNGRAEYEISPLDVRYGLTFPAEAHRAH